MLTDKELKDMRQTALCEFITSTACIAEQIRQLCKYRKEMTNSFAIEDLQKGIDFLELKIMEVYAECFRNIPANHRPDGYLKRLDTKEARKFYAYKDGEITAIYHHFNLNRHNARYQIKVDQDLGIGSFYADDINAALPEVIRYLKDQHGRDGYEVISL